MLLYSLALILRNRFSLQLDASAYGAGAVLLQEDADGIEHPISYFSKKKLIAISRLIQLLKKRLWPLSWLFNILRST